MGLFILGLGGGLVFEVEEHEGEDEDSSHHGEGADVIGVSAGDEALVLGVLQRTDGNLT